MEGRQQPNGIKAVFVQPLAMRHVYPSRGNAALSNLAHVLGQRPTLDLSPYLIDRFGLEASYARRKQLRLANLTPVDSYVRRKAGA